MTEIVPQGPGKYVKKSGMSNDNLWENKKKIKGAGPPIVKLYKYLPLKNKNVEVCVSQN